MGRLSSRCHPKGRGAALARVALLLLAGCLGWNGACAGGAKGVDSDALAPGAAPEKREAQPGTADTQPDGRARVQLYPVGRDPVEVGAEVVYTAASRQKGLMYRKQLGVDAGMLFLFDSERQLSFWMRNTYIPLDMIFIRNDMTVLGVVENAEPLTDDSRSVPGRSQFVLEVNAGYCRQYGISEGTRVSFEGVDDEFEAMPGLTR